MDDVQDHIKHVDEIVTTLANSVVTLNIPKCHFFERQIEYLGHMIKPVQLEIEKNNVELLYQAKPPTENISLFLGLYNVYRRFIDNFIGIAHPLNNLLKKRTPDKFQLDDDQKDAFQPHINKVCSHPILALPKVGLPYSIDFDASDYGVGFALFKPHRDEERKPIGFWSISLL